jgi:hypothetical protein
MIYLVEMALLDTERRAEWDPCPPASASVHPEVPRQSALRDDPRRGIALRGAARGRLAGDLCQSSLSRERGPSNTGEWQAKMDNWHRNLFAGADHTPGVPMDARLVVLEEDGGPVPAGSRVRAIELRRSGWIAACSGAG